MGDQGEKKKLSDAEKQAAVYIAMILVVGCLLYFGVMRIFDRSKTGDTSASTQATTTSPQIHFEPVDLQVMLDDLNANAMRAEDKYQDKYIEITEEWWSDYKEICFTVSAKGHAWGKEPTTDLTAEEVGTSKFIIYTPIYA